MPETSETPFDASLGIYNPGTLPPEVLLQEFIARRKKLATALDIVRKNEIGQAPQHLLVLGPRGMGKTMFLLALAYSVQRDADLCRDWLPIIFPEETYDIGDLADFWLSATAHLLEAANRESALHEIEKLRDDDPEDIESQAQALFLRFLSETGKRALVILENLDEFFRAVADEAAEHRLRAFLMESDRVMIAASSPTYFSATGKMDRSFYDFFRLMRLERFRRDEMIEVLTELAKLRQDTNVTQVIEEQPERLDSLRVLTGGNPRLVKMIYRLLNEGGMGSARQDLDRLLEDCTPYFKHRIEELASEERRVFDHVARHWDPVNVADIQRALRRPSNKVSIYLRRLVDRGFIEEAENSTPKRKAYQVAERFYNIYYLMRFSRSGKRRLAWLVQAMRVLYSEDDFRTWTEKTLATWRASSDPRERQDREAYLYSLTKAANSPEMRRELVDQTVRAAWDEDQLDCLDRLLDQELGREALGDEFDLIDFFARLPKEEKERLGYDPDDAEWWYKLTWPLEEQDHFTLAEKAYGKAIELDPKDADPWNGLGNLLTDHMGRHDEAERAYRKAIELDPKDAYPWYGLGNLLTDELGRHDEAERAYRNAIKLNPQYSWPWNGLGNLLTDELGRHDEAERAYRRAIELDPKYAYAWYGFANALKKQERYHESEGAYREATELDPKFSWPWNNLGNLLKNHSGRYEEAESAYRKAIELDPNYAKVHANLADLLSTNGRDSEAHENALLGVQLDCQDKWPRSCFLKICGEDSDAWIQLLPTLFLTIASESTTNDSAVIEMALRGFEFVLTSGEMTPQTGIGLLVDSGADAQFEEIVIALRSLEDESLLSKLSPERRTVAVDFLKKVGLQPAKQSPAQR